MGRFEGTEEEFESEPPGDGPPCFEVTRSTFALHGAGPVELRIEATGTYYFAPEGTYRARLADGRGDPDRFGENGPIPATATLFAQGGMVDPDGGPCRGTGHFWRGTPEDRTVFHAEWTWDHDCQGLNNGGGSDAAIVPAGTRHVLSGTYEPCFDPPCHDNIQGVLIQRLGAVDDSRQS